MAGGELHGIFKAVRLWNRFTLRVCIRRKGTAALALCTPTDSSSEPMVFLTALRIYDQTDSGSSACLDYIEIDLVESLCDMLSGVSMEDVVISDKADH